MNQALAKNGTFCRALPRTSPGRRAQAVHPLPSLSYVGWGIALLLLTLLPLSAGWAAPVYQVGCEAPLANARLCWESSGEEGAGIASEMEREAGWTPLGALHLFPVIALSGDPDQILVEYSRGIYRQIMGSGLASQVVQEWQPATTLEEALLLARMNHWKHALWILPRAMRESSSASPGVVDLQVYLLDGDKGMVARITRVRVESHPDIPLNYEEILSAMGVMQMVHALANLGLLKTLGLVAKVALETRGPPNAGYPLELMSELAIRHIIVILQTPIEQLGQP